MLYALDDLLSFLLLLVATVVALTLHGWVTALLAARTGDRQPAAERRLGPDPRRQIDPFGFIAALIGGVGWSLAVATPARSRRGAVIATTVLPAAVLVGLGLAVLAAFRAASGGSFSGADTSQVLRDAVLAGLPVGELALATFGVVLLYTGVMSLVPLLPLAGGRLLFALAPRTRGWQQAEHQLGERNIGTAILLGLLLLAPGLVFAVLDAVGGPLAALATGG